MENKPIGTSGENKPVWHTIQDTLGWRTDAYEKKLGIHENTLENYKKRNPNKSWFMDRFPRLRTDKYKLALKALEQKEALPEEQEPQLEALEAEKTKAPAPPAKKQPNVFHKFVLRMAHKSKFDSLSKAKTLEDLSKAYSNLKISWLKNETLQDLLTNLYGQRKEEIPKEQQAQHLYTLKTATTTEQLSAANSKILEDKTIDPEFADAVHAAYKKRFDELSPTPPGSPGPSQTSQLGKPKTD